eukprot:48606-Amphidinium_carterae.1
MCLGQTLRSLGSGPHTLSESKKGWETLERMIRTLGKTQTAPWTDNVDDWHEVWRANQKITEPSG